MFIHTRTFRLPWTKALRPKPAADLNPIDAAKLGIKQGDAIKIRTPKGEISVFANISDMVMEGVVCMYHGYKEADVNSIIPGDYLDPVSGYPGFKSFLGKIEKAV
jgi:anaerobic selenocysteine-containing dehydrogenase